MRKRLLWWLLGGVLALAALAVLIPVSPFFLPGLLVPPNQYEGHSAGHWRQALNDPDAAVRSKAVFALGAIGVPAGEWVPDLARVLRQDPDSATRSQAALALSKMNPASRAAVAELAQALEDEELLVRMNAAIALRRLRKEAYPAVPALIKAATNDAHLTNVKIFHFTIQEMAVLALGSASTGTAEGIPTLIVALEKGPTDEAKLAAVRALGDVGPEAQSVALLLRPFLKHKMKELREASAETLELIGASSNPDEDGPKNAPDDLELPEPERALLWEIEHHGNLLVKYGFGTLAEALKTGDRPALTQMLATDFAGTDADRPLRVSTSSGPFEVERLTSSGQPPLPLNRDAFLNRLLGFRKLFSAAPLQVKLSLMTLTPKDRENLDGIWEGKAQLRLYGESSPDAPAEVVALIRYEVVRPSQESLSRPGWLRSAAVEQVSTARASQYLFAEVASQRGLEPLQLHDNWKAGRVVTPSTFFAVTGGVFVADFDNDGILDLLLTDVNGCALYRGRPGGSFEDVTKSCGLPRQMGRVAAAWADLDGDGWKDLLLGDKVFHNVNGDRFLDVTSRCNLRVPNDAANLIVADYDRDGKLDVYVTRSAKPAGKSWLDSQSSDTRGNILFHNLGGWRFEDATASSGTRGGARSTFTAAWLDANNDGWPDLHVPNEFGDGGLFINKGNGTFAEQPLADRPADFGTMGLAVGDVDNDGHIDIYCANMYSKAGTRVIGNLKPGAFPEPVLEKMRRFVAGSQLHLNKGGLKFDQVGKPMQVASVGWAYGASLADLDNDGWLDVYATAGFVSRDRSEPDG